MIDVSIPLCPRCGRAMAETLREGRYLCAACSVHAQRPSITDDARFRYWAEDDDGVIVTIEIPID